MKNHRFVQKRKITDLCRIEKSQCLFCHHLAACDLQLRTHLPAFYFFPLLDSPAHCHRCTCVNIRISKQCRGNQAIAANNGSWCSIQRMKKTCTCHKFKTEEENQFVSQAYCKTMPDVLQDDAIRFARWWQQWWHARINKRKITIFLKATGDCTFLPCRGPKHPFANRISTSNVCRLVHLVLVHVIQDVQLRTYASECVCDVHIAKAKSCVRADEIATS